MNELEIQPKDLVVRLAAQDVYLLDCRELEEHQVARIEPSELIPMNTIPANLQKIEGEAEVRMVVVYCHHGMRSLNTVGWLRRQGIENTVSLAGGIDRWSLEVDPAIPRY